MNNKFGASCGCPALSHGGFLGSYVGRRDLHVRMMESIGVGEIHSFRERLINNGHNTMHETRKLMNDKLTCQSRCKTRFHSHDDIDKIFMAKHMQQLNEKNDLEMQMNLLL